MSDCFFLQKLTYKAYIATNCNNEIKKLSLNSIVEYFMIHAFLEATFLEATPGWNWQKIKQKLRNTLKLNLKLFAFFIQDIIQK